jgi:integrase
MRASSGYHLIPPDRSAGQQLPPTTGGVVNLTVLTAAAAWDHWYARLLERRLRPETINQHRKVLWGFWRSLQRPAGAATRRDLDRWLGRPVAVATQRNRASILRGCYGWLHSQRLIRRDPMAGYVLPKVSPGVPRDLDPTTVRNVLALASLDERDLCMLMLAYGAGLRAGEIARARLEHVHLGPGGYLDVLGKAGKPGTVPLAPMLAGYLAGYLATRPHVGPLVESRTSPGRNLSPKTVSGRLGRLLRAAGVNASGHALRHTFATQILAAGNGTNIRAVQRLLRHEHLASTQIYTRRYEADAWAAIYLLPDPTKPPRRRRRGPTREVTPYAHQP